MESKLPTNEVELQTLLLKERDEATTSVTAALTQKYDDERAALEKSWHEKLDTFVFQSSSQIDELTKALKSKSDLLDRINACRDGKIDMSAPEMKRKDGSINMEKYIALKSTPEGRKQLGLTK